MENNVNNINNIDSYEDKIKKDKNTLTNKYAEIEGFGPADTENLASKIACCIFLIILIFYLIKQV